MCERAIESDSHPTSTMTQETDWQLWGSTDWHRIM